MEIHRRIGRQRHIHTLIHTDKEGDIKCIQTYTHTGRSTYMQTVNNRGRHTNRKRGNNGGGRHPVGQQHRQKRSHRDIHTYLGRCIQGVRATDTQTDRQTHAYSRLHAEADRGRERESYTGGAIQHHTQSNRCKQCQAETGSDRVRHTYSTETQKEQTDIHRQTTSQT